MITFQYNGWKVKVKVTASQKNDLPREWYERDNSESPRWIALRLGTHNCNHYASSRWPFQGHGSTVKVTASHLFLIPFNVGKIDGTDRITSLDFGRCWSWYSPWSFKVKYWIGYISGKMVQLLWNENQAYRLNARLQTRPSILSMAMTFTLRLLQLIFHQLVQ